MAYILECKHIDKTYQTGKLEVPVLYDVNFTMEEGEYVAIMGPSGSGKSTLMNIIGCLDRLTAGELYLDGEPVSSLSEKELAQLRLRKVGFVFQTFQLLPGETALENVELPLTYAKIPRKDRREIALKALERVGLSDRVDFKPSQLSGGQKQRVAIARAVVNHPKILLADEPTGALDSKSGRQVMELFRSLNEDGMSVLMITHDREIASYADRIVEIRDGILMSTPGMPTQRPKREETGSSQNSSAAAEASARPGGIQAVMEDGFFDDVDEEVADELEGGFFENVEEPEEETLTESTEEETAEFFNTAGSGQTAAEALSEGTMPDDSHKTETAFTEDSVRKMQNSGSSGEAFAEKKKEAMQDEMSGIVTRITDEDVRRILEEEDFGAEEVKTSGEPGVSPIAPEISMPESEFSDEAAVEILHLAAGESQNPDGSKLSSADIRKIIDESDGNLPEEV